MEPGSEPARLFDDPPPVKAIGGLSREKVLSVALKLFMQRSWRGFNMRELAQELGVTPMAIYNYCGGKHELLQEIIDRHLIASAVTNHGIDKANWRTWLKQTLLNIFVSRVDGPWLDARVGSTAVIGPGVAALQTEFIEVLEAAGLSERDAVRVLSGLYALLIGRLTLAAVRASPSPTSAVATASKDYRANKMVVDGLLNEDRFDRLSFEIDMILDSAERMIEGADVWDARRS